VTPEEGNNEVTQLVVLRAKIRIGGKIC